MSNFEDTTPSLVEILTRRSDIDLAKEFADIMKNLPEDSQMTWDDFFDKFDVPKDNRTDLVCASILKQAKDKYNL